MKLIVGLGNPGSQYQNTRHNAGFMAVDRAAARFGAMNWRAAHEAFACDVLIAGGANPMQKVILLKPLTYMNLSGRSVASAMAFYKLTIEDLLVVVDDLALPCGTIRLRATGSAGGHNGLTDIQRAMGGVALLSGKTGMDYARLRIGIDPPGRVPQKSYVLEPFSSDQKPKIDAAMDRAVDALACWAGEGIASAMNKFNPPPVE